MNGERPAASIGSASHERSARAPFPKPPKSARDQEQRSRLVRALQWAYAWMKSSPWAKPLGKGLLAAFALGLLAALGGSALAGAKDASTSAGTGPPASAAPATTVLAETVIEAPHVGAGAGAGSTAGGSANANDGGSLPVEQAHPPSTPASATGKASAENPVSLNSATLEDLRRLPGIGPKKAEAILALRTKLGKFKRPEDLMRVKGIGRGTFKKLRPLVRVDE